MSKTNQPNPGETTPGQDAPAATGVDATTEARFKVLEEELLVTKQENDALAAKVANLSKSTKEAPDAVTDLPTVKVGKDVYRFAFPKAIYKGRKITADDVRNDAGLLKELIDIGSGMLVKQ